MASKENMGQSKAKLRFVFVKTKPRDTAPRGYVCASKNNYAIMSRGIFISISSPFLPNIKRTSGEHECHPHVSLLLA